MTAGTKESTEDAAAASAAFRAVASSIAELVFVWAPDGRMLWTSDVFDRETGMTVDDFRFKNQDNPFIHPEDLPHVNDRLGAFMESDATRSEPIVNRFIDAWGRTQRVTSIVHKVDWNGESALLLVSSLGEHRGDVNEADVSYRQVVEGADDSILRLAADGRIVYANRRFQQLVQLPAVAIGQRRLHDFVEPADRHLVDAALSGRREPARVFEVGLRSPSDGLRRLSVKASHVPELDPATPYLAIVRDVTEERKLEETVWRKQKLESLGLMAAGIAHDFNNIATAVVANAELAQQISASGESIQEVLEDIRHAGERAAALNRALLAYVGQAPLEKRRIQLDELLRETMRIASALVDKTAELRLGTVEACSVRGDPGQISQIVLNLLTNAAQSLCGKPGRVDAALERQVIDAPREGAWFPGPPSPGSYARLAVRDQGIGIERETLARVFEPFYTTKGTGRGLGLSAAFGIVRAHGGALRVESRPGVGTLFEAWLPLSEEEAVAPRPGPSRHPTPSVGGVVLFADDEALIRRIGKTVLQRAGFEVELACDGEEALGLFRANPARFSAVVIDTMMPRMRGDLAARQMRVLRPDLAIVRTTGYIGSSMAVPDLDAVLVLPKPYTPEALVDAVCSALAQAT